jgi:hypothetical protein
MILLNKEKLLDFKFNKPFTEIFFYNKNYNPIALRIEEKNDKLHVCRNVVKNNRPALVTVVYCDNINKTNTIRKIRISVDHAKKYLERHF